MDRKPYDAAYKYLFSNPRIACQLLHSFVDIPFVKEIRPDDLELVEKSFISPRLQRREADLIYKVKIRGKDSYIYILMEFQSSPDKAIPVRMLNYIMMFYEYLFRKSKAGMLPAVLPLLIYNGSRNWKVPYKLQDLIRPSLPARYIPHFEYYPIIEKDYSEETLFEINNLISAIMIIENSRDEEKILVNVERVAQCLKREHREDIMMFHSWFNSMNPAKISEKIGSSPEEGGPDMLAEVLEKMSQKWMSAGLEQGLARGKISEKHDVLIRQLDLKYGLTEDEKDRIQDVQLPGLLDSALDAIVTGDDKSGVLGKLNQD